MFVKTSLFSEVFKRKIKNFLFLHLALSLLLSFCRHQVLQSSRSTSYCASMQVLSTVENSAKCHLSTCALMINTVLMVSINFLLHRQKAAVALSLSWPCACFWEASFWQLLGGDSMPLTYSRAILQTDVANMHTLTHTHWYLKETHMHTIIHGAVRPAFQTFAHR